METLTPLLRRVLGSLPTWREDEDWVVAHEVEVHGVSIRRHNLAEMHNEVSNNPHAQLHDDEASVKPMQTATRPMTPTEVERCLDFCVVQGWASMESVATPVPGNGDEPATTANVCYWRMTQKGFEEIHRPEAAPENVVPGPVELDLQPAIAEPDTSIGVDTNA